MCGNKGKSNYSMLRSDMWHADGRVILQRPIGLLSNRNKIILRWNAWLFTLCNKFMRIAETAIVNLEKITAIRDMSWVCYRTF